MNLPSNSHCKKCSKHFYTYIYIYIYTHTNFPVNAIVRQPNPQSGDSQGQELFLAHTYISVIYKNVKK